MLTRVARCARVEAVGRLGVVVLGVGGTEPPPSPRHGQLGSPPSPCALPGDSQRRTWHVAP